MSSLLTPAQAHALSALLVEHNPWRPYAEMFVNDSRAFEWLCVCIRSDVDEELVHEVFIDDDGAVWRWVHDPECPFDETDSDTWCQGWFAPFLTALAGAL